MGPAGGGRRRVQRLHHDGSHDLPRGGAHRPARGDGGGRGGAAARPAGGDREGGVRDRAGGGPLRAPAAAGPLPHHGAGRVAARARDGEPSLRKADRGDRGLAPEHHARGRPGLDAGALHAGRGRRGPLLAAAGQGRGDGLRHTLRRAVLRDRSVGGEAAGRTPRASSHASPPRRPPPAEADRSGGAADALAGVDPARPVRRRERPGPGVDVVRLRPGERIAALLQGRERRALRGRRERQPLGDGRGRPGLRAGRAPRRGRRPVGPRQGEGHAVPGPGHLRIDGPVRPGRAPRRPLRRARGAGGRGGDRPAPARAWRPRLPGRLAEAGRRPAHRRGPRLRPRTLPRRAHLRDAGGPGPEPRSAGPVHGAGRPPAPFPRRGVDSLSPGHPRGGSRTGIRPGPASPARERTGGRRGPPRRGTRGRGEGRLPDRDGRDGRLPGRNRRAGARVAHLPEHRAREGPVRDPHLAGARARLARPDRAWLGGQPRQDPGVRGSLGAELVPGGSARADEGRVRPDPLLHAEASGRVWRRRSSSPRSSREALSARA